MVDRVRRRKEGVAGGQIGSGEGWWAGELKDGGGPERQDELLSRRES